MGVNSPLKRGRETISVVNVASRARPKFKCSRLGQAAFLQPAALEKERYDFVGRGLKALGKAERATGRRFYSILLARLWIELRKQQPHAMNQHDLEVDDRGISFVDALRYLEWAEQDIQGIAPQAHARCRASNQPPAHAPRALRPSALSLDDSHSTNDYMRHLGEKMEHKKQG
jgi:hypothetical protein